jgi:hypothetical protein
VILFLIFNSLYFCRKSLTKIIEKIVGYYSVVSIDLIGWLPLNRIASLDASLPFILLQPTAEMELCLLPNCHNHFLLLPFDCAATRLTPIQHMLQ